MMNQDIPRKEYPSEIHVETSVGDVVAYRGAIHNIDMKSVPLFD
jgi:hypothetical protein